MNRTQQMQSLEEVDAAAIAAHVVAYPVIWTALTIVLAVFIPVSHSDADVVGATGYLNDWRSRPYDGLNCLYVELRCSGYLKSYTEFRKTAACSDASDDAAGLVMVAERCGIPLDVRKLTRVQLASMKKPVVVYVEPNGVRSGEFWLLMHIDSRNAAVVVGPSVRRTVIATEEFHRIWTGHAIVPANMSSKTAIIRHIFSSFVITIGVIILLRRYRPPQRPRDLDRRVTT